LGKLNVAAILGVDEIERGGLRRPRKSRHLIGGPATSEGIGDAKVVEEV
jgi:hypothetical protein